ncbi:MULTISPECIES: alpha/beta hydrolase [unclassified Leptolyngbya]|uniref:alpha/beta hydrolase n=1 Tax=unclassified Leptolyngbya TaxID=2650499 RepID=UPI0016887A84|nr:MULTISPECIES: alpha/beta hydrolase [unclassified Leptolyngbya]MBD1912513.1 alpha/beta hydrolase [Leptolyngbya sp. FACHB-8]MBD2156476.1 alpha/beta hydrolase [Leptolyngbya sp. FACHB-16]
MKWWNLVLGALVGSAGLLGGRAIAAEEIVLTYGSFQRSVGVEELTALVQLGEVTNQLDSYFDRAEVSPERVRQLLTEEIPMQGVAADRILNNPLGDALLDRVSEVIYPEPRSAGRGAMRAAIVLSSVDNDKLSLLEILQNYPTSQVYVDVERLADAYSDIQGASQTVQDVLNILGRLEGLAR